MVNTDLYELVSLPDSFSIRGGKIVMAGDYL